MTRTARLIVVLAVLVAHVAAAVPVTAAVAEQDAPVPAERAGHDDCCPSAPGPETERPSGDEDCCPDGCRRCPLSCCGAAPVVIGERVDAPGRSLASPALPSRTSTRLPAADPRRIKHPPRG